MSLQKNPGAENSTDAAAPETEVRQLVGTRNEEMTFKRVWTFLREQGWKNVHGDKLYNFFFVSPELKEKRDNSFPKMGYAKLGTRGKDFFTSELEGIDLVRGNSGLYQQYLASTR